MTSRTKPALVLGRRYRISHGGSAYSHLGGLEAEAFNERTLRILAGAFAGFLVPSADVNYKVLELRKVCRCRAYKWPHRQGGGLCLAAEDGPFCGQCGQPCEEILDKSLYHPVSNCCGDEVFVDCELRRVK